MGRGMATKSQYRIPIKSFEKDLMKMNFCKTKATPMAVHYRRADGLHAVLIKRKD